MAIKVAEVLLTGKVYSSYRGIYTKIGVNTTNLGAANLGVTGLYGDSLNKPYLLNVIYPLVGYTL